MGITMTPPAGSIPPAEPRPGSFATDVHLSHRFSVEIGGVQVAGFMECSGISIEHEMLEYAEGGENTFTHKLPGRVKYGNVTLRRGILAFGQQDLMQWFMKAMQGKPAPRKQVTITSYDSVGTKKFAWVLESAYPVKYTGPEFKTDSASVACESLELSFTTAKQDSA
jgi:phage tail-like protein